MRSSGLYILILFLIGMLASPEGAQPPASPLIGRPAPDFQLTDTSGQPFALSSLKGKTVVLDFWATWCPPCREELPALNRLAQSFYYQSVTVLGIDAAEDPDTVRHFLQENPLSYRILLTYDNDSPLKSYGVQSYPFLVIVDRNGVITDAGSYPPDKLEATLRTKLEDVLAHSYISPRPKVQAGAQQLPGVVYPDPSIRSFSAPVPDSAEQLFLHGSLDLRMNRLAQSLLNANSSLRIKKDWLLALRLRARIYSRQGKNKEAIADCTTILSKSPEDAEIYALRAQAFLAINQQSRALDDYRREANLDSRNPEVWLHLSSMYLSARNLELAQKAVDHAIELSPERVEAYQIRAQIEKERGDWKAELADMDRMLLLEPTNSWAKAYRPDVVMRIGQPKSGGSPDDTYAVYSTVLLHPIWNHVDDDSLLLIAEETGATYGGMDPAECIKAPLAYQKRLDQILASYQATKSRKVRLEPRFRITRRYKLLNHTESQQFGDFRFRGKQPPPGLAALFHQTPDLIRLSPVFFSDDHTMAIVLVSNYCGGLCGGEKWRILVKRNGAWIDEDWTACTTIS